MSQTTPPAPHPLSVQEGGSHYKDMKIQPVEFAHANGLEFIEGSVIKYVTRHRHKNGKQDLLKAIHFLQLLIALEYDAAAPGNPAPIPKYHKV